MAMTRTVNTRRALTHAFHHFLHLGVLQSFVDFLGGQAFHGVLNGSWWHVFQHVLHITEVSHEAGH